LFPLTISGGVFPTLFSNLISASQRPNNYLLSGQLEKLKQDLAHNELEDIIEFILPVQGA
jgi:hypothetical protein